MNDTAFERYMLQEATVEARKYGAVIKEAWVHKNSMGRGVQATWEFHYRDFYWYGRCENAYHAKALGWTAWLEKQEKDKNGW